MLPGPSAQSKLADTLVKRLDSLAPNTCDVFGLSVAATIREDSDVDPIL